MNTSIISLDQVQPDPQQPRRQFDQTELEQLAASMTALGQLQPVIVFRDGDVYHLVDGERRFRAMKLTPNSEISAIVLDSRPDETALRITQMAANTMRADLLPTEQAAAIQQIQQSTGWSNAELARQLHMSKSKVTQILSYLKLPAEVREQLDDGTIAGSTAYAISRAPNESVKQQLIAEASSSTLKRDDATRKVSSRSKARSQSIFRLEGVDITVTAETTLDLAALIRNCQRLIRECRRAERQHLDLTTLQRVLADQRRASA